MNISKTASAPPRVADGFVIVDKPAGVTSHTVVARLRRIAGTRKVGHAGTLDPMATGLLVCGIGRGTRLLTFAVGADKTYQATIRLGATTVTDDHEGDRLTRVDASVVTDAEIAAGVAALTGEIDQVPSAVSAVKVAGKRAYALVRAGEQVELKARRVRVSRFDVLEVRRCADADGGWVDVDVEVRCSSGTYVRALARDLGAALGGVAGQGSVRGVGGHLTALRRTGVGQLTQADAFTLEQLEDNWTPTTLGVAAAWFLPVRILTAAEAVEVSYGRGVEASGREGNVAALDPAGALVAVIADRGERARCVAGFVQAPKVEAQVAGAGAKTGGSETGPLAVP